MWRAAPFYCAEGSITNATGRCMASPAGIPTSTLVNTTNTWAGQGSIDPVANLQSSKVYLFSGSTDSTVKTGVMDALKTYYNSFLPAANVVYKKDIAAEHAMITDDYGSACSTKAYPYINDCHFDLAGALLGHVYGALNARNSAALPAAGLLGVQTALAKRKLKLAAAAGYERNTDKVEDAVKAIKASDAQAVIMISINKPTAAFVKQYRESGDGAQLYNLSLVDPAEIVRLGGLKNAHGLGISEVVPSPFMPNLPVVREYQALLKKHAPDEVPNYTSFEEFLGAKVFKALESMGNFDLGGTTVNYLPANRVGARYVEVTGIGRTGKLLK